MWQRKLLLLLLLLTGSRWIRISWTEPKWEHLISHPEAWKHYSVQVQQCKDDKCHCKCLQCEKCWELTEGINQTAVNVTGLHPNRYYGFSVKCSKNLLYRNPFILPTTTDAPPKFNVSSVSSLSETETTVTIPTVKASDENGFVKFYYILVGQRQHNQKSPKETYAEMRRNNLTNYHYEDYKLDKRIPYVAKRLNRMIGAEIPKLITVGRDVCGSSPHLLSYFKSLLRREEGEIFCNGPLDSSTAYR